MLADKKKPGGPALNENLFVRQATGLVRSWSVFDAFIYSFFSINLVALGMYIFAFAPSIPEGNLITALVISAAFILFEVIVYSQLISLMPRSGGDYIWQSRILGGGIGFVVSVTGWVMILWHWVPIYGSILGSQIITPLLVVLGKGLGAKALVDAAVWFTAPAGVFTLAAIVVALAFLYNAMGMNWYARMQKVCFYIAMAGLALTCGLLLTSTPEAFAAKFNAFLQGAFGVEGNSYTAVLAAAAKGSYTAPGFTAWNVGASFNLIPLIVFFNLWPNWGSTLYGEVRGASEYRRNFAGMAWAVLVTTVLAVLFLAVVRSGMGWEFYNALNWAAMNQASPLPVSAYPGLLAAMLTDSLLLQVILILAMGAWFVGWCGTVFLSSTRVIFAAAFDRLLPESLADVTGRTRMPLKALLVMTLPGLVVSAFYAFSSEFASYTLDATLVIAFTYLVTTVAATIVPFTKPELYKASPVAQYKVGGIPLISLAGVIFLTFLGFVFYKWMTDDVYGVNSAKSALYMGAMYLVAILLYVGFKNYRKKQGIDMDVVYESIPVE